MADRGILFSAPMVRALLADLKDRTRRVLKGDIYGNLAPRTPNIKVGDHLWVREAWATAAAYDDLKPSDMGGEEPIRYDADGHHQTWGYPAITKLGRKRPGMFMPRWASRLTLIVTEVRVQRLQEISEADARAEGLLSQELPPFGIIYAHAEGMPGLGPIQAYARLWNEINGSGAWDKNPWVAAYTFTVIKRNIDQITGEAAA